MSGFGICILTVPNNDIGNAYPTTLPFSKSSTVQLRHLNRSVRVKKKKIESETLNPTRKFPLSPSKPDSGALISTLLFFSRACLNGYFDLRQVGMMKTRKNIISRNKKIILKKVHSLRSDKKAKLRCSLT